VKGLKNVLSTRMKTSRKFSQGPYPAENKELVNAEVEGMSSLAMREPAGVLRHQALK